MIDSKPITLTKWTHSENGMHSSHVSIVHNFDFIQAYYYEDFKEILILKKRIKLIFFLCYE